MVVLLNTFCDNSINVLLFENLPPIVDISSNVSDLEQLVVGGSVTLNLS